MPPPAAKVRELSGGRLFLFDIDQTLLYTGGAGQRAMELAFQELYGIDRALEGLLLAGRTDIAIFREALARHGRLDGAFPQRLRLLRDAYHRHLAHTLRESQGQVLPGVRELLEALRQGGEWLGVATGNFRRGALMKLGHYGLADYFAAGGFGDDAEERPRIIALAARRLARRARRPLRQCLLYVLGDTPEDVAAARANGAVAVAVATGRYPPAELSSADLVFPDLADTAGVLGRLGDLAALAGSPRPDMSGRGMPLAGPSAP